jgi:Flp pilus assembly protein TadG
MSLLDTITRFSTATLDGSSGGYTVTRTPAGTQVQGRYTPGTQQVFTIDAVVEPLSGRDIKVLAAGEYAEDTKVLWTSTPLFTIGPSELPDQIVIAGDVYSVANVQGPWNMSGVTFYKVTVARQRIP